MKQELSKVSKHLALSTIVIAAVFTSLVFAGKFVNLENSTWDARVNLTARPNLKDSKIKIITISQSSLDHFAKDSITWPWPRPLYIPVIEFLKQSDAKGLAFDLLFTETSVHGVADDKQFADSMQGDFPVINAVSLNNNNFNSIESFEILKKRQYENLKGFKAQQAFKEYNSATLPIQDLLKNSKGFGTVNANPDADGLFRHYPLGFSVRQTSILSLPFAFYFSVTGKIPDKIWQRITPDKNLIPKFYGPAETYETFDIVDVVNSYIAVQSGETPKLDPSIFKDSWVFLGVWAPGLLDLRPISLDEKYRGVEFVATVLDNIIHQSFIFKTSKRTDAILTCIFILFSGLIFIISKSVARQVTWIFILIVGYSLCVIACAENEIWIAYALPVLGSILVFCSSLVIYYYHEGRQHKFLKEAFGHYVNKEVIKKIVSDPNQLSLGGEKRVLTIFFSDLAGFTSISEAMEPTQLTSLLNEYLSLMTDIILASGGTLDKYEGDAIIAFWNAPLSVDKHELRAVKAALDCQGSLRELKADFNQRYGVDLNMRIGINTGEVVVGNFGSKSRFNYTMIGDAANLAARLEGVNKVFGTRTLISETTNSALSEEVYTRKIGSIRVVGRKEPVNIFEPCDYNHEKNSESFVKFENSRLNFENGKLDLARKGFASLQFDSVAKAYLKRIEELNGDFDENWSPVWNLTDK